jgi:hypothetical protein
LAVARTFVIWASSVGQGNRVLRTREHLSGMTLWSICAGRVDYLVGDSLKQRRIWAGSRPHSFQRLVKLNAGLRAAVPDRRAARSGLARPPAPRNSGLEVVSPVVDDVVASGAQRLVCRRPRIVRRATGGMVFERDHQCRQCSQSSLPPVSPGTRWSMFSAHRTTRRGRPR